MKRRIIIMYTLLTMLTGCGSAVGWQTGDVTLVRTVGVDRTQEGVRISAAAGARESGEPALALRADGVSVADGIRALGAMGDSALHFGHVDQLLLGEDFVQDGVEQLLDFVARNQQIGPGAQLWVLRDDPAEQAVTDSALDVSGRLERLSRERGAAAHKVTCTVTRLMSVMAGRGSVVVPALRLEREALQPAGYAVLRQGRLVGFLDWEQSLGVELLHGQSADQLVDMSLSDAAQIVLRVKRAGVTCVPTFDGERLQRLELRYTAHMDVAQGAPLTQEQRQQAVQQAQQTLCHRMAAALAFAQFWDADFIGLEQMARENCSGQEWANIDWQAEFRALPLRAAACVQVNWPPDMMEEST